MSFRDWKEPPEEYEETPGGIRTGSEILADLEDERESVREKLERHGPAFPEGVPCANCGAYLKFLSTCPLCGGTERRAA